MPLTDGSANYIMQTDGAGQVSFVDPATIGDGVGAQQIDDLTDGKSDNDGTNDGSSIFLGIGAGTADDSSNNQNTGVGFQALMSNTTGYGNVAAGNSSLQNNSTGYSNVGIGWAALQGNTDGFRNIGIGEATLLFNTTGDENIAIGHSALQNNLSGTNNTAVGSAAGLLNTGSANIFLGYNAGYSETGSNKLYIENSNTNEDNALLYGEFDNDILRTNGELQIGNPTGTGYALPTVDGTTDFLMQTDGAGQVSFIDPATIVSPDVTTFPFGQMHLSANQALTGTGWVKILFDTATIDVASDFNATSDRFIAPAAGIYQVDASFHSNAAVTATGSFGIAVYVNGSNVKRSQYSHYGNGLVHRGVHTALNLAASDYVEIYVYKQSAFNINSNLTRTSWEIERVR
jgi:hypothetical protein